MLIVNFIMICFISDLINLVVYSLINVNQERYLFKVVKNVLAPMCTNILMEDIGNNPFSLFVDEATDKAGHMCYFGKQKKCIISSTNYIVQ